MGEHIMVNGRELNFFDLPPKPKEEYTVHVDGIGDVVVEKGEPPRRRDWVHLAVAKLDERISALEQSERIRKAVEHG